MTDVIAAFFAGAFAVNGLPHFLWGISGEPFQSPFASPPGVGESPPWVNVLWGASNFAAAGGLVYWAGLCCATASIASLLVGALAMALTLAWHFGKVRKA